MNQNEIQKTAVHVWKTAAYEIERLCETVPPETLEACVKLIADCKGRIITAGVGTSGAAAKKIAHSLSCIERPSFFLDPGDSVQVLMRTDPYPIGVRFDKAMRSGRV